LQEWFVRLSPAVPQVESVGVGTGSGFLIRHEGKYLVVTNRHVIENARQGVAVHFPLGGEKRLTVPKGQTRVVAIHRSTDLALVDVTEARAEIDKLGIEPVQIAAAEPPPKVGQHVFAIGHPGGGEAGVLTSTLSDGIVSAVGRKQGEGSYLQVTVPINPGNSGGPLFDDEGRVVGVNSFGIRGRAGRDIPLEALNFALEGKFVHEIVSKPDKSLGPEAIKNLLNPPQPERPQRAVAAMEAKLRPYLRAGYRYLGGTFDNSTSTFRLASGDYRILPLRCERGAHYAIVVVSEGVDDLDLAVFDRESKVVAADGHVTPAPEVRFQAEIAGNYYVLVANTTDNEAQVVTTWLKK
jgi:S1-C subfamily serine protease